MSIVGGVMLWVRKVAALLLLWLPAATITLSWAAWNERLPSELPTHWGASGPKADGATPSLDFLVPLLLVAVAAALVASTVVLLPLRDPGMKRGVAAVAAAAAAFVTSMWLGSTVPSLDVTDPYTVELGAWLLLTIASPAYGLLPLILLPRGRAVDSEEVPTFPPVTAAAEDLPDSWSVTIRSKMFAVLSILLLIFGLLLTLPTFTSGGWSLFAAALVPMLIVVGIVAAFAVFRVTVDEDGLTVRSLTVGLKMKQIPLEKMVAVESTTLEPSSWGGWGYRIMPGRSAIILRRGPGLVVTLRDERQFAISLYDPQLPAQILLALLAARQPH